MPRIYNSESDPLDFCNRCFPKSEEAAFRKYGGRETGPDGRGDCFGYDCEHPPYDDVDYRCHRCRVDLTDSNA